LVFHLSTIAMMHCPINIRFYCQFTVETCFVPLRRYRKHIRGYLYHFCIFWSCRIHVCSEIEYAKLVKTYIYMAWTANSMNSIN